MSLPFELPVLSSGVALVASLAVAGSYVGSLYLFKSSRLVFARPKTDGLRDAHERQRVPGEQWRNDPRVIKARLTAVSLSTALCCALVFALVWHAVPEHDAGLALETTLEFLGFAPDEQLFTPHLLTPLLFAGPLYVSYLDGSLPFQHLWSWQRSVKPIISTWEGVRNYIVGPITEEINFRSCVIAVLLLGGFHPGRLVFTAPLAFGIAHVHHAWDLYNRFGQTRQALQRAVITCLVQLTYTTLFGAFCTFLFLRTGSVLPTFTSHIFCNLYGLPNPVAASQEHSHRRPMIWFMHFFGVVAFSFMLWPWSHYRDTRYYWEF
ncbi:hypothetical protein EXIGLDRAFT_604880 [Exidia glandulosa HHB12029]|uniref:intramembrane prenyl-peptidase Rce1 n=1 Tax=Exidia glandulosa HHB12029 TaxID=1314781 RepID=A0A165MZL8_EXIGL|nr:hypothetical protein EXIGLDRAFT_604880 [Exidia glandulosa HHB12029]